MNIQTLTLGPLATNCYLVRQDGCSRAVIIDPAPKSFSPPCRSRD